MGPHPLLLQRGREAHRSLPSRPGNVTGNADEKTLIPCAPKGAIGALVKEHIYQETIDPSPRALRRSIFFCESVRFK